MNTNTCATATTHSLLCNTLSSLTSRAVDGENVASKIAAVWTMGAQTPKVWNPRVTQVPASRIFRLRVWALLLSIVIALDRISFKNRKVRWNAPHVTFLPPREGYDGTVYDDADDEILADGSCWVDPRPDRIKAMTEKTAERQMAIWKKAHDSETISNGVFADAIGPYLYEFTTAAGKTVRLGYQGKDGLDRCPTKQGCDAVLDSDGRCPKCGYSSRRVEESAAFDDFDRYLDSLDRRIVVAYKREYDYARQARLSAIIHWIANADVERIADARSSFYKRVVASRKQCAKTGLWFHSYLTRQQVDTVFAVIEYRQDGGEVIGTGAPTAMPVNPASKPCNSTLFSDNLTMAQAQWALSNRPARMEHHNLSKAEYSARIAKLQVAWPKASKPLTVAEYEAALDADAWKWAPGTRSLSPGYVMAMADRACGITSK